VSLSGGPCLRCRGRRRGFSAEGWLGFSAWRPVLGQLASVGQDSRMRRDLTGAGAAVIATDLPPNPLLVWQLSPNIVPWRTKPSSATQAGLAVYPSPKGSVSVTNGLG
jgi:hypothetical protein